MVGSDAASGLVGYTTENESVAWEDMLETVAKMDGVTAVAVRRRKRD